MAFLKVAMVLVVVSMAALVQVSMGAVYKVGDSAGWTTIGSPDYKKWAASKTFHVGDSILFVYNAQFHNVMQVNHAEFQACNNSAPITTHTSGNDSITIKKGGHYYFLCGIPGHCQAGQKVDIRVVGSSSMAPASAPTIGLPPSASVPTSSTGGKAPGPSPKNSAPIPSKGLLSMVVLAMAIFSGFTY